MASLWLARKEHRKNPFLKAFVRIGCISRAARAVRISRDAVYDWRHNDPTFEAQFQNAKRRHKDGQELGIETALGFFEVVARRALPREYWARLSAELAIAMTNLKNDLRDGGPTHAATTGKRAGFPMSPKRFVDVAIPHRGTGNSAINL